MQNIILGFLVCMASVLAVEVGQMPPSVTLSGKNGGKVDGTPWHSKMLHGKVYIFFYVDPDKKDLNNAIANALQAKNFDPKKVASVAVINLKATWMPNMLIASKLKEKQKQYPNTLYVKDKRKILVKKWQLADDNSDVLIFDKSGTLRYKKFGKLSQSEIQKVIRLIEKNL
ncbi:MAG: transcriptional regulator [Sulfurovum sp.]|nr:MAG: transcriptional regulator [Sulfurovum sp.]